MERGNILGNFLKTTIEYEDGKLLQLVTLIDDDMYEKSMNGGINEIVSFLDVVFSEDDWVLGNEQFIFSDYGKAFDSVYGFSNNSIRVSITPDVSLAMDGKDWWWDT